MATRLASVTRSWPSAAIINKAVTNIHVLKEERAKMSLRSAPSAPQYRERDVVPEWPRKPGPTGLKNDQATGERRSIGRRIFRTLSRFLIAVLIGVGGTLIWQSHGDEAKEMVRTWVPSLAWLVPASTTNALPAQEPAAAAVTSPELAQQIQPMMLSLNIVRRSLEQLSAKQEQMAESIATLQAIEQDIKQTMSSSTPSRPVAARKPPQPTAQSSSAILPPPAAGSPLPLRADGPVQSAR
jgi:hypothetical protein